MDGTAVAAVGGVATRLPHVLATAARTGETVPTGLRVVAMLVGVAPFGGVVGYLRPKAGQYLVVASAPVALAYAVIGPLSAPDSNFLVRIPAVAWVGGWLLLWIGVRAGRVARRRAADRGDGDRPDDADPDAPGESATDRTERATPAVRRQDPSVDREGDAGTRSDDPRKP